MSWLPSFNALVVFIALPSLFLWNLPGVGLFLLVAGVSFFYLSREVLVLKDRFVLAFWLFILSEVAAFGSLLATCLWSEECGGVSISDVFELPLLGTCLLLGSSVTVSSYHHTAGLNYDWVFLWLTIVLGVCFVGMQVWEFYDCTCDWLFEVYFSSSFSTVGLHFTHVVIGLFGLLCAAYWGVVGFGRDYLNIVVWYWHFVDYIWLLVLLVVYIS